MGKMRIDATDPRIPKLLELARLATQKAFLTKPGGTMYGAAVLTSTGEMFSSGQYSSFNHITNIHAEMGAILIATMANEPDIIALALVSSAALERPERPCGICREFIHEHAKRLGHDILICMGNLDGTLCEFGYIADLLPHCWTPAPHSAVAIPTLPWHCWPFKTDEHHLHFGDMVQTQGRFLSLVWEPEWTPGTALVKLKYDGKNKADDGKKVFKFPHSFTEYGKYLANLKELGLARKLPWGEYAYILSHSEIEGILPRIPISQVEMSRIEALITLFAENDIPLKNVSVTGSWAARIQNKDSDLDIVVEAPPQNILALRSAIATAIGKGAMKIPMDSGTWKYLHKIKEDTQQLIQEKRFVETLLVKNEEVTSTKCSLIYTRPENVKYVLPPHIESATIQTVEGTVIEATENFYKRGIYLLQQKNGRNVRVTCWHKLSGLLHQNDVIQATGAFVKGDGEDCLLQMDSEAHTIQWMKWS